MSLLWAFLATIILVITLPGTLELLFLTVGAILPTKPIDKTSDQPKFYRTVIVVPAHNEETGIENTVLSAKNCKLRSETLDIVVIADNCTDRTAAIAESSGARVFIRTNLEKRGKGFALQYAIDKLMVEEFDIFVFVDADTVVDPNMISEICDLFRKGAAAVQVRDEVLNAKDSIRTRLMTIAFLAFNILRPKGRERWGLSVGIFGNGFALLRETLSKVPYSVHSIVEDLEYHLLLVEAGYRVRFAEKTSAKAKMPISNNASSTQRLRWEGGRFNLMIKFVPQLFIKILSGQYKLIEPLFDLLLLPLSYHTFLLIVLLAIPFTIGQIYALVGLCILVFHVLFACKLGKGGLSQAWVLAVAPFYLIWKIFLLSGIAKTAKKNADWIRTKRN